MAIQRYVLTATVTVPAGTAATVAAGEPGTGAPAGPGNAATVAPGTSGKYGWLPQVLLPGQVIWADPAAGSTGPQLLYAAIGPGNLRAYADTDAVGHAAPANLAVGSTP
jgi:hypothetical protein